MHYARTSRNAGNRAAAGGKTRSAPAYLQRCAVRVTYLNNRTRGQWKAHGRYLARESATFEHGDRGAGFSRDSASVDLAERLQNWQAEGDERLWKLIVSPEFGDQVDLSRLTRDLTKCMEEELATKLEWAAAEHHNTEHAHIHIALRGRRDTGDPLHLNRQFIQNRIREIAGDLDVVDLGDAEMLLNNPRHLGDAARQLLKRGIVPTEDGWGGWLGRYQSALCKTTREIEERNERDWVRKQERRRDRSRGR
jgi:hypothetical protein